MIDFLNALCERNPELQIFILMWDFSALVSFDKEWFNKFILDLTTNERIHFRFDGKHALYASHHQKLVVIDGAIAFVGGLDLAANSWDDRRHWADNAERFLAGSSMIPTMMCNRSIPALLHGNLQTVPETVAARRRRRLSLDPPSSPPPDMQIKRLYSVADQAAISVTRAQTCCRSLNR